VVVSRERISAGVAGCIQLVVQKNAGEFPASHNLDGGSRGVCAHAAIPVTHQVARLTGTFRQPLRMIESVDKALCAESVERGIDVGFEREHVSRSKFLSRLEHAIDTLRAPGRIPFHAQKVRVVIRSNSAVGRSYDPPWRVEETGQLFKRHRAGPIVSVISAGNWHAAIPARANGDTSGRVITNVSVDVRVDHVLTRRVQSGERFQKLVPILSRIQIEKDIVQPIVESPTQGEGSLLAGDQVGDDGSVPRDGHVNRRVGLVLYVDDLAAVFEITPTLRGQILSLVVDCFNVEVLDGWPDVGESPTDALVVSDNHKGQAGQTHAGHIEIAAA